MILKEVDFECFIDLEFTCFKSTQCLRAPDLCSPMDWVYNRIGCKSGVAGFALERDTGFTPRVADRHLGHVSAYFGESLDLGINLAQPFPPDWICWNRCLDSLGGV